MSTQRKILFSALLIVAIVTSMVISLGVLVRPTYEYDVDKATGALTFSGYNGNANITELTVEHPMVKSKARSEDGPVWQPDESAYVTSVERYTVQNDEYLEEIHIGPHVTNIDECAFVYCKNLKGIYVDEANEYYTDVDGVLYTKDMKLLVLFPVAHETNGERTKTYTVPEGVERLARNSFYKCDTLEEVKLPDTLKELGNMTFFKCGALKLVDLPESVTTLGSDVFSYCNSMKYAFYIPAGVESIDHHCFYKCDHLEQFYVGCGEDEITLGGQWMPKSENSFTAKAAQFNATLADRDAYNAKRLAEEEPPAPENGEAAPPQEEDTAMGMNKTAVIVLIVVVFIPSIVIVGLEVVRNLFKDDFMMTKRGREKLARQKAEKEAIHQAYVNGEYDDSEDSGETGEKEEENDG